MCLVWMPRGTELYVSISRGKPFGTRSTPNALWHGLSSWPYSARQRIIELPNKPVISIVDDDQSARAAMRGLVRSLGYTTAAFASAEDFLTSDQLDDTVCAIVDVHMPGMSGLELQGRLAADGRRIPVIVVTAYPSEDTRAFALEAGALGFLSKPCDEQRLIG
jgi:FixJ family two-component response regulator